MLRAKANRFKKEGASARDRILSATDTVGNLAGIPVISGIVNTANQMKPVRKVMQSMAGIHADATVPKYHSNTLRKRMKAHTSNATAVPTADTTGKVALFATCYGNRNEPNVGEDLVKVFEHNGISVVLTEKEKCCGMPKLELGDLDAVFAAKEVNIPVLSKMVDDGYDLIAPVPSCTLMFKQELPLMFPDDPEVAKVRDAFFDPFEYLMLRHKAGKLNTDFKNSLGKIAWHVPCHQRVQNIGPKTREILQLVGGTEVETIERCSGHDGTYAVKKEFHEISMKICRPVTTRVEKGNPDHYTSDCPMAGHQIENGLKSDKTPEHPLTLLRIAYGL
jgi:glycerol-3-phosphate dehydrogenase subunit C